MKRMLLFILLSISISYSQSIAVFKPEIDTATLGKEANVIGKLLLAAIQGKYKGNVIYSDSICGNKDCGIKIAKENNYNEVIFSSVLMLGNKFIFTSSIVRSDGSDLFSQKLTTNKIEDFEELCDRMAEALLNRKNVEVATSVENVTEQESEKEVRRGRLSYYSWGLSVGIGYPVIGKNSFRYSSSERRPMLFKLGWTNLWEFKNNFALDLEFLCFLPASMGGDASVIYFFKRSDFSPFAGGGVGIHFFPDKYYYNDPYYTEREVEERRLWGPSLNIQGGLMLFRTYNINLITRAQYHVIFTDDIDNGVSGDITLLLEASKKERKKEKGFWDVMSDYIKYTTLATVAIGLISFIGTRAATTY